MQSKESVCPEPGRIKRISVFATIVIFTVLLTTGSANAGPATTVVNDVVFRADGSPASGTLLISWPAFSSADGKPVAAGSMSLPIGPSGLVTVSLTPNEGASPTGTFYKVVLKLNDGTTSTEYWTIPSSTPAKISQIRTSIVPASVAMQMASRQYVDTTLANKADNQSVIHVSGTEQVSGVKQFSLSPTVPTPSTDAAVANKSYVDTKVASINAGDFIRRGGDVMAGALTLAGDPSSSNHAANRHYVDLQVTGVNSSVAQKLARQGDTPITMAGARYASQFADIQAAMADAGTNGTVIIPSDYSGTDAFSNPNKVQVVDLRGDAAGNRGFYNVRDFGAKPDDSTDDWAAIQAAIDAASVGVAPWGAVYVPKGTYYVSKPLHITRGIKFYGAGRGVTTITGYSADQGPVMVISPPTSLGYNGIPTGPSLATGAGNSMYLDGTFNYMLNLREAGAVELNGRSALTIDFFYKPDVTVPAGQYNIISSSGSVTGPDASTTVAIQHASPDTITAMLNVGGVIRSVSSPNNSVVQGSVHHIALSYDGTTIRLFINGVLKGSTAATGTISQKMAEDFVLGPKVSNFMETSLSNYMTKGWVDSIRISSTARYTTNFTPPSAKATNDGNTMFLLNFDNNYDQFTVATTMFGSQHLFLRRFGGGMGQVGNFHLSDLSIVGTGPEFIYMISSMIDNVQVTAARRGLQFINNCYLNRLTSVRVIGQQTTQFGVGIGAASGVLTFTDLSLSGAHYPFYMDTSSAAINGLWIEATNGTEIAAVFRGIINNSAVISHPVFSTETNPNSVKYMIAEIGMGTMVMSGGTIESGNGAPHVGVFGGGSIVHIAANYSLVGTPPASIYQIVQAPTYPVQLISPIVQNLAGVPWADNMAWMQAAQVKTSQTCSGTDKVTGINATGSLTCAADQGPGYTLTLVNTGANSPSNSTSYYFGGDLIDANNTNFDAAKIEVPKAGTIKRIYVRQNLPAGNTASGENVIHKVCINSGTNCFGAASFAYNGTSTAGSDGTLNQPVAAGDTLTIRVDTPAWVTRPSNVRWYAVVYIE